ncbi:MAG: hypothetical protein GQF41_4501 [Candidatus Rifleibacterium amylolyticum]|nr:MAG: hypothetical protein GQF41_4501 [Candidatus Rifleibacterium amylolyticum]
MKILFMVVVTLFLLSSVSFAQDQIGSSEPAISLFKSVEIIKEYLSSKAKQDYSDKYLYSVSYHFSQGHPRKGACWLYHFAFKIPRLGGSISIYHFMDGEIIEFHHGP